MYRPSLQILPNLRLLHGGSCLNVAKIIYHQSKYHDIPKPGGCGYRSLEVKMRLAEDSDLQPNTEGELWAIRHA
jgi:hypothetical protein